jgi:hypothetical protein
LLHEIGKGSGSQHAAHLASLPLHRPSARLLPAARAELNGTFALEAWDTWRDAERRLAAAIRDATSGRFPRVFKLRDFTLDRVEWALNTVRARAVTLKFESGDKNVLARK